VDAVVDTNITSKTPYFIDLTSVYIKKYFINFSPFVINKKTTCLKVKEVMKDIIVDLE